MQIILEGTAKEIADLAFEMQNRLSEKSDDTCAYKEAAVLGQVGCRWDENPKVFKPYDYRLFKKTYTKLFCEVIEELFEYEVLDVDHEDEITYNPSNFPENYFLVKNAKNKIAEKIKAHLEITKKEEPITLAKLMGKQLKLLSKHSENCDDKYLADITDAMNRLFQLCGD